MPNFGDWMQSTFGPGWFGGINFGDWVRLLLRERCAIAPRYWPRAAFITTISLITTTVQTVEEAVYDKRLKDLPIDPPLFILGHPRSGTTHLHNLISLDERFGHPTMYEVNFPQSFMLTEKQCGWLLEYALPTSRPMDNMSVGADSPQEDEWAQIVMSQLSPYVGWSFPKSIDRYQKYWTLNEATEAERHEWQQDLLKFCRKLQWTHGRPMVMKSPAHTCRVRWLLPLFPNAKFVHVHRNPYEVFRSTQRLWQKIRPFCQMQIPEDPHRDDDRILKCYREMHQQYFEDRESIPADHLCEVRYDDIEKHPLETMEYIYEKLNLPNFGEVREKLEAYLQKTAGYQKNRHQPLPPDLVRRINTECHQAFEEWGYRKEEPAVPAQPAAAGFEAVVRPAAA